MYSKNWIFAESIQANTRIHEQASSKLGGGDKGVGGGRGGYLNQSLTAAMFLRMSDVIACTDVMWTLFTRMISLCETERNSLKQKLQKK